MLDEPISLEFYRKIVTEYLRDQGLAASILAPDKVQVYHGTSRKNAESITRSGKFRPHQFLASKEADAQKFSRQAGRNPTVLTIIADPGSLTIVGGYLSTRGALERGDDNVWR